MTTTSVENGLKPSTPMKQARTWAQIARLSGEALAALDSGKTKDARGILVAIRGVALNADHEGV
jgi:hypothetical protein